MTDYQKFQLQWMIDHNHSIDELIDELEKVELNKDPNETLQDVYDQWEIFQGFGGEIWPCIKEWQQCDC